MTKRDGTTGALALVRAGALMDAGDRGNSGGNSGANPGGNPGGADAAAREHPGASEAPLPGPAPLGAAWLPLYGRGCNAGRVVDWALVDADRVPRLAHWRWSITGRGPWRYPGRLVRGAERRRRVIYLHHAVLPLRTGVDVDHANGDTRDARRANLRYASDALNQANRQRVRTATGHKGTTLHRATGRYQAAIKVRARCLYLGLYDDVVDAARAYWHAAVALYGQYAWTNLAPELRTLPDTPAGNEIRRRVRCVVDRLRGDGQLPLGVRPRATTVAARQAAVPLRVARTIGMGATENVPVVAAPAPLERAA